MEWITSNWYILILGLVTAMFFFGRRTKVVHAEKSLDDKKESHTKKSDRSCCH